MPQDKVWDGSYNLFQQRERERETQNVLHFYQKDLTEQTISPFYSQHAVLETEANQIRASILDMAHCIRTFTDEVSEYSRKLVGIVQQIEGGEQIVEDEVGMAHTEHVRNDRGLP